MKFEGLLTRNVRGLWVTTYSFGLRLFDQYVLRSVSQSPLNAVVLADDNKLAEVWENLGDGDHYLARKAGRRYLLRGVRPPGGGAFHPKTYLFSRSDGATLVVGSGNLTRGGIDRGHEVFTNFDSRRQEDLPSMRAWGAWVSSLVDAQNDHHLRQRWLALREGSLWLPGPAEGSSFLANDRSSILDQLVQRLPDSVAELHLSAPFFDRDALALARLIDRCDPDRVLLYIGAGTKVHGPSLAEVLGRSAEVQVLRFEPRTFVHAKLIGAIGPDGRGVLLTGSPNLSRAALLGAATEPGGGNCETAVLRDGTAEQIRAVFAGSQLGLVEIALGELDSLEFEEDEPVETGLGLLRSATWRGDGRIAVEAREGTDPSSGLLSWSEAGPPTSLDEEGVSQEALVDRDPRPVLVWLVDGGGEALTNRVPVDDPVALEDTLTASRAKKDVGPPELQGLEASPLVRMALWAHDKFIFDLDQTPGFRRAQEAAAEDSEAEDASDFWDRYAEEELRHDPRSQTYRPMTPGDASPVDELLRELQAMLYAAPDEPVPSLWLVGASAAEAKEESKPGTPWTMEARQRIRAFRLFMRWSKAIADPRHRLIGPDAPAVNYSTLLGVILAAWIHEAFDHKHLQRLLLTLLTSFVGTGEGYGLLGRSDESERDEVLCRLDPFILEAGCGLTAAALRSEWRAEIYNLQPVLRRALDLDVLISGERSVQVHQRLTGELLGTGEISDLLGERIRFVDNDTWCKRLAEELGLQSIALDLNRNATVRAAVTVRGSTNPLEDVRLLTVARRFLDFKHLPAVALFSGTERDVLIFEPGQPARAMVGGVPHRSSQPVSPELLEQIERQGGSWADLLGLGSTAAA